MHRNVRTAALLCYRARAALRAGDSAEINRALDALGVALDALTGDEPGYGGVARLVRGVVETPSNA